MATEDPNLSTQPSQLGKANSALPHPVAKIKEHHFEYHGITRQDPYNWLRDPNYPEVNDPEILAYLEAENAYFHAHMAPHKGLTNALFEEIKGRQPDLDACVPYRRGEFYYQWRYNPKAQYRTWYRRSRDVAEDVAGSWQQLFDENEVAAGHDFFRLGGVSISPNARWLLWSSDRDGSERYQLRLRDLDKGHDTDLEINLTYGSGVWSAASDYFFYTVVNAQWRPYRIMRHRLGSDPTEDVLVFEETDEGFRVGVGQSQSDAYIFISAGDHVTSDYRFIPAHEPLATPQSICPRVPGHEYSVDHREGYFYLLSNDTHKNFRLARTPVTAPGSEHWETIIHGCDEHYLMDHTTFKNHILVTSRVNGLDTLQVLDADHNSTTIAFPEATYSAGEGMNAEYDTDRIRLGYESMVTPDTDYDYHIATDSLELLKVQDIPSGYDPQRYTSLRLTAPARDGAQIPISIVYAKDFPRDGSGPLYLYGYGAYGSAIAPGFSTSRLSLLDRGYAFAIAHIRGGDDLGYQWYEDGKLDKRTNTFNDFVDVARYLIEQDFAQPGGIAIAGGSAGGELMGAVVNQSPELWGAVVSHVPFVDVLNTMLDASLPLTPMEWPEWGNPITDKAAFENILSYSPYDQLAAGAFPPMLVTAGLNDPRVTYWEPAKYVAKLRALKTDDNWLLLKTNMGAGHGGKSGRFDSLEEIAEEYAFILQSLGGS